MSPDSHWASRATEALKESGRRSGGARAAVIEALAVEECAVSAEDLSARIAQSGRKVGRASVYRALEALDEVGHVQRIDLGDGSARWERTGCPAHDHHHHHMVCRGCGAVIPFEDERLERALAKFALRDEFDVESHEVTLYGNCAACGTRASEG